MADRGDTHYDIPRLNLWFLCSAALLLGATVWMVLADWDRGWKDYQRDYQALEYKRAEQRLAEMEADPEWLERRDALRGRIAALQEQLADDASYQELVDELREAEGDVYRADGDYKNAKAMFNWERFRINQARAQEGADRADASAFEDARQRLAGAQVALEEARARRDALRAQVDDAVRERDAAQAELGRLEADLTLVTNKIRANRPGVFNRLRNAPMLDFVAPSVKVRKQVLPDLRKNYNFVTVQRVDMCASCHVSVDDPSYAEDALPADLEVEPVLRAHPRLDLYVSPTSPHPLATFGCTVCHEGAAETLDFTRAVHTPDDEEQAKRWHEELGWEHWHLWEWPMYPRRYTEAGCYSCHALGGTLESLAEEAPKLTRGLRLMEDLGCYSCHKIGGWRVQRKPGPSLRRIAAKVEPAFARSWIAEPRDFRPATRMPQIFHLENSVSPEWDDTTISAIQAYLWSHSEKSAVAAIPADLRAAADAERGEALFQQVGCTACHNSGVSQAHDYSGFGPDLTGIGSKVGEDWLYQWILDPTAWWPETRMPDLRLEPQQAADIAVFLAGQGKDGWVPRRVEPDAGILEEQALDFLRTRMSLAEARRTLDSWRREGGKEKVLAEVGRRWISRQGCYSCHDIPGFETSMPIGTELTDWGNKNVHKLAFELWDENVPGHFEGAVSPSRQGFAELKLSNPRRFDRGLEIAPLDRLRMPEFHLQPDEIEAITTVLLGLKDESATIRPAARPQPDAVQAALEKGSFLVRRRNCEGCHKFEMDSVRGTIEFGDGTLTKAFHGLVTLEDDDDEATWMQLWKTDPDLEVEDEGAGAIAQTVGLYWEYNDDEPWPIQRGAGGGIVASLAEYYVNSGEVDDAMLAFPLLPPILYREGEKVRVPWVTQFLLAPYTLRPWLVVRMPTFHFTEDEARAVATWFPALAIREWPERYTRALRAAQRMSVEDLAAATRVDAAQIRALEEGRRFDATAFDRLRKWGDAQGFAFDPPPHLPFEEIEERRPEYLAAREAAVPGYLERAATLIGKEGIDCYACHIRDGRTPGGDKLSWGPDLSYARERLRPDWVRAWIRDAQKIYPGTKMPTASGFIADPKLQAILKGTPEALIEAVKDFLMNSDRVRGDTAAVSMSDAPPGDGGEAGDGGN